MRICIYCASSPDAPQPYRDAAFELGRLLAKAGATVVFGGGGIGSMGSLADGVHAAGGRLVGVMPHFMRELESAHRHRESIVWTKDMAERKALLRDGSDALVALPGGVGTFEELLEALTLKRLGLYDKPIIIVNQGGYYDPLIAQIRRAVDERFMDERHLAMFTVVDRVDAVLDAIGPITTSGVDSTLAALDANRPFGAG
jgi:uncharacterized protein (TIGR00730 family)